MPQSEYTTVFAPRVLLSTTRYNCYLTHQLRNWILKAIPPPPPGVLKTTEPQIKNVIRIKTYFLSAFDSPMYFLDAES